MTSPSNTRTLRLLKKMIRTKNMIPSIYMANTAVKTPKKEPSIPIPKTLIKFRTTKIVFP